MQTKNNPFDGILQKEAISIELAERKLSHFVKQAWHIIEPETELIWGWYLDAICDHLEAATNGNIRDLIINVPPRHLKSLIVSVFWFVWSWIHYPGKRWVYFSYSNDLTIRDSVRSRALILSDWFQSRWGDRFQLTGDQNQKMRFSNNKGGYRIATSVKGIATGEGGHFIICLPYNSYIQTIDGRIQIGKIVEEKIDTKVYSFNHISNRKEIDSIVEYQKNPVGELVDVELENRDTVTLTKEHEIFIPERSYIESQDVTFFDYVLNYNMFLQKINNVKKATREIDYTYNLKIQNNNNYFAGNDKSFILLHNCDDPINIKEVDSEVARAEVIRWWDEVVPTRIDDPKSGVRVIIMQRGHEDDLTGYLLNKKDTDYVHVCLPARYEPDNVRTKTPLNFVDPRTEASEPLHPARYGDAELKKLEDDLGSYATAAQLQQNPYPRGGGMFKIEKFGYLDYLNPHEIVASVRYWDKASSVDVSAKETAGVLMHKLRNGSFVVADVVHGKWVSSVREQRIKKVAEQDGKAVNIWIEQEPGSGGKDSAEGTVRNLAGYIARADRVTGSKIARADIYSAQVDIGNVYLMKAQWNTVFLAEHGSFPKGKLIDIVDAASGAFNKLFKVIRVGTWGKKR